MLQYEFKERNINQGNIIYDEKYVKLVQYKTGYDEFMVSILTIENIYNN